MEHCLEITMVCTYLPSRFMFCDIAPFSFSMESIILTGSSRLRPDGLLSCRALLVVPLLSKGLLLWQSSDAADTPASVCLMSAVQVVLTSVSAGSTIQLSSSTSTMSTSLRDVETACHKERYCCNLIYWAGSS